MRAAPRPVASHSNATLVASAILTRFPTCGAVPSRASHCATAEGRTPQYVASCAWVELGEPPGPSDAVREPVFAIASFGARHALKVRRAEDRSKTDVPRYSSAEGAGL